MTFTAQQIADKTGGRLAGDGAVVIGGVETLDTAAPGHISFIRDAKHAPAWPSSKASAALVGPGVTIEPGAGRALIHVPNADLALVAVLEMFAPPQPRPAAGVHPRATVDPSAVLGADVAVGPGCVIGPRVRIGPGTVLHANVTILDDSTVGAGCVFWPGVVVRDRCTIGDRCIIHANAVIGADGFGFTPGPKGAVKIPHIGTVVIDNDVEIGAATCIDRAKFSATVIGDGTKLDNLVQIAHNVRIGKHCLIAAQVAIAGSAVVGDGVIMGGQVGVRDHVTIGSGVQLAASAAVMCDVPAGEIWGGIPAQPMRAALREQAAIRKLPELLKSLRKQ